MDSKDKKYTILWSAGILGTLASIFLIQYGNESAANNYEDRMEIYAANMSTPAYDAVVIAEENMQEKLAEINTTIEEVE